MSQTHSYFVFDNNATCDIFYLPKQRKLSYDKSHFIASNRFELLHFDILGPLVITLVHNHIYFLSFLDD